MGSGGLGCGVRGTGMVSEGLAWYQEDWENGIVLCDSTAYLGVDV